MDEAIEVDTLEWHRGYNVEVPFDGIVKYAGSNDTTRVESDAKESNLQTPRRQYRRRQYRRRRQRDLREDGS